MTYVCHRHGLVPRAPPTRAVHPSASRLDVVLAGANALTDIRVSASFHKWFLCTPDGRHEWNGLSEIAFEDRERYFVAMGPVFQGCHAIVDLDTRVLQPFNDHVA